MPLYAKKLICSLLLPWMTMSPTNIARAQAETPPQVLMVEWRGLTDADRAFRDRLRSAVPGLTIVELDAAQDRLRLATELRRLAEEQDLERFKLIYCFGTPACLLARSVSNGVVPVLFNVVWDETELDDGRLSGVSNQVPMEMQLAEFRRLLPLHRLAVIYNRREPNALRALSQLAARAAAEGVELLRLPVSSEDRSLDQVLEEISTGAIQADAIYTGPDHLLISRAAAVAAAARGRIPLLGASETYMDNGWLAVVAADYRGMGEQAAMMAEQMLAGHLVDGTVHRGQGRMLVSRGLAAGFRVSAPAGAELRP